MYYRIFDTGVLFVSNYGDLVIGDANGLFYDLGSIVSQFSKLNMESAFLGFKSPFFWFFYFLLRLWDLVTFDTSSSNDLLTIWKKIKI